MDVIQELNKSKNVWTVIPKLDENELVQAINLSAENYYNTGMTLIPDDIYDFLVERLKILNPDSEALQKIGFEVKGKKTRLPTWLGSMNKIKTEENLIEKWVGEYSGPYVVSDKLDGISCLLTKTNGTIELYTRGDGSFGQRISHLLGLINSSTDNLPKTDMMIRGELIMEKDKFIKYAEDFSNARNTVAGLVNSKKESLNKKMAANVDFIVYEVIEPKVKPSEQMKLLHKWKMNVVYYDIYQDINLGMLDTILQKRRKKSVYEIDGIIVTDDRVHPRNKSGNPPYSFAYKGMTATADVKVIEVIWTESQYGYLVPRIHFKKTKLSGVDLEYTTGFHAKFIKDNKIGPGAIITIVRSGDVIPYILAVVKPAKEPDFPDDKEYEWDKNGVNIVLVDVNDNTTVIIKRLTKFLKEIGVEYMSEGIVTRLVNAGYDSIPKIMSLTVEDFLSIDGFQETLANKLYTNLDSKLNSLDILSLMTASNVFGRGFGSRKIKKILEAYPNIVEKFNTKNKEIWKNKLMLLDGFDTITVDKFIEALPDFKKFYKNISKIWTIKPYKSHSKKSGLFKNQVVVFTGFRNKPWEEYVVSEGGRISGSVSSHTTLLVYNDGETTSSKYQKAKKLGIKTLSKSEFAAKYDI